MGDFSKVKRQPPAERMTIKGETFVLLGHNPKTDIWVYGRTYGHRVNNIKKCIEVIKPVYRVQDGERIPTYPSDENFGSCGYCCNSNDCWLREKLAFWLENGLERFVPPTVRPRNARICP